jgi:predicted XRE-type DNA-binding protein
MEKTKVENNPLVFDSVWDTICSPEKAAVMKIKSNLMQTLQEHIKQQEYSQVHVAKLCKTTQPRISNLIPEFIFNHIAIFFSCLSIKRSN